MPSHLVPQNPEFFDRWVEEATRATERIRISANSPWQGYTPDLDPNIAPPNSANPCVGLVARPDPNGRGEVLMPDAGFTAIDAANLPITTASGSNTNVTMIAQFNRTDSSGDRSGEWDKTSLVLVGGDNTVGTTELWRLVQAGTWELVPWTDNAAANAADHDPGAGREFLPDWAEFPAGAPGRTAYSGAIEAILEPCFVWCSLGDRVMVYPVQDGSVNDTDDGAYETLTDRFGGNFCAATVEHFNGRLYFGNTKESGTHHRQRIRRTALFTADPLETTVGAGAFDIRDFSGDLLRLEKLGDVMAAYFEDGVAFIRSTDVATAPDGVQLLRERRGLISTHAVTSVGDQEHFGIFDDGWFFLDPSGRWTEAGIAEIDGVRVAKWKETFYSNLDITNRHRLYVEYDGRYIRIAYPQNDEDDIEEVWIYDPRGNRVFRDRYPITVFGLADTQLRAGVTIDGLDAVADSIDELSGTIESYSSAFGLKALLHGTRDGYILNHDYGSITKYDTASEQDVNPSYSWSSPLSNIGDPTVLKRVDEVGMEYIQTEPAGTAVFTVRGDTTEGTAQASVALGATGTSGDIDTAFQHFIFTSTNLGFTVSGTAPILIRSFYADVSILEGEERKG